MLARTSTTMACWSWSATPLATPSLPSLSFSQHNQKQFHLFKSFPSLPITKTQKKSTKIITKCSNSSMSSTLSWSETQQESSSEEEKEEEYTEDDEENEEEEGKGSSSSAAGMTGHAPPVRRMKRRRYRKQYPGEKRGITEEMRFVAMKLRNGGKAKAKKDKNNDNENGDDDDDDDDNKEISASDGESDESISLDSENAGDEDNEDGESWEPSIEGFLKYVVDSKLVFSTVERIVDESSDVSYAYFRKTGLERSECLSKDLEWFSQQGNSIPEPSNPGITYAKYLEETAENSPPLFMCHFYNIYFSHIAGGQVIAKKVSNKLLEGRELEFFKWEGNEEELLRDAREKLNMLGEHWTRDVKNKCLREATKAFRFLGQIVRLIIL